MTTRVVVIGAGMGGLAAAATLARKGLHVTLLEARSAAGGLAGSLVIDGLRFDAGPYVILDLPGLSWLFASLGADLQSLITLERIEELYEVSWASGESITFHADLDRMVDAVERRWPGHGIRYRRFVNEMSSAYATLSPLLTREPTLLAALRSGALSRIPLLLRSLGDLLRRSELPSELVTAIGIWTHVAAQKLEEAPAPLAFVPALIHGVGAHYPQGGIGSIMEQLQRIASESGVTMRFGSKVQRIVTDHGRVSAVETETHEVIAADAVISNASGVGTYLELLDDRDSRDHSALRRLPLQSPGLCLYAATQTRLPPPYLRFRLGEGELPCQLLVAPSVVDSSLATDERLPVRLIAPTSHAAAEARGAKGQEEWVRSLEHEQWWRGLVPDARVLHTATPRSWGDEFHLYRDSMNPVMTAQLMRRGRLPHRATKPRGLYLAGSSTHPGQWISFAGISGVLAANALLEDF